MQTISANDLFDFGSGEAKLKLDPKLFRLEFYDNGPNCKKPMTQYGLVLDFNNSEKRWNINFGVIPLVDLVAMRERAVTREDYRHLDALLCRFAEDDLWFNNGAHVATSKRNNLSGTGRHDLGYRENSYDHSVGAVLVVREGLSPVVHLFINGEERVLDEGWERVTKSSHAGKKFQVRF